MTEGYQPPRATYGSTPSDHETSTLPGYESEVGTGWSNPQETSIGDSNSGSAGLGAKLASAASAATAAATAKATSAKESSKAAAADSERRSGRVNRTQTRANRQPRRARLTLSHINVYSVFKFACVLSVVLFFIWLLAVAGLYGLLESTGVLNSVNKASQTITGGDNAKPVLTGGLVFGGALILGVVNIVLFIAISTVGSMVYNLLADVIGGVEVTLSERD